MTSTDLTDQASIARQHLRGRLESVRNDPRLSEDGKRAEIAAAWLTFQQQSAQLRALDEQQRAAEIQRLEGRIFRPDGSGVTAAERAARQMSFRDALRDAEQLPDDEAGTRRMHTALRSGDDDLARAVLSVALDRGWPDTANRYLETHTVLQNDLERLWDLRREQTDMRSLVSRELRLSSEQRPPELSAFRDDQLEQVAEGALTVNAAGFTSQV